MIEPFYNLKKHGKNKEKTRNFVLKTRISDEKGGLLKTRVSDEKDGLLKTRVFDEKDGLLVKRTVF